MHWRLLLDLFYAYFPPLCMYTFFPPNSLTVLLFLLPSLLPCSSLFYYLNPYYWRLLLYLFYAHFLPLCTPSFHPIHLYNTSLSPSLLPWFFLPYYLRPYFPPLVYLSPNLLINTLTMFPVTRYSLSAFFPPSPSFFPASLFTWVSSFPRTSACGSCGISSCTFPSISV